MIKMKQKKEPVDLDDLVRQFVRAVLLSGILNQQELAQLSGISRSGLAHWLAGKRSMTLRNASRLVSPFGYERFVHFLIKHGADSEEYSKETDFLRLLEQVNTVLRQQLHEALAEHAKSREEQGPDDADDDHCEDCDGGAG